MTRRRAAWTSLALVALLVGAPFAEARGYKRHLDHHPRLTFDARDAAHVARVRDRILARQAPWADAYEALRRQAEQGQVVPHGTSGWKGKPDRWAVLFGQEVNNGLVARAKAAVAWLGAQGVDPAWLPLPRLPGQATPRGWLKQQAAEAAAELEGMFDEFQGWRGWDLLNRGIVSGESLLVHAQALDLLQALPADLLPPVDRAARRVAAFAEDHQRWAWVLDSQDNNHPIRVRAGLGAAGVALNRHDRYRWWNPGSWRADPADWVRGAERELDAERRGSDLRCQTGGGAYAEGTAYHAYAEAMYAPFFLAYTRFDGDRPLRRSPRLEAAERWSVAIRLPEGARPSVDNAPLSSLLAGGFLANRLPNGSRSADQRRLLGWDWLDQGAPGLTGARALELLAAYDPSDADAQAIAAFTAPAASAFLPDAGAACLRAGGGRGDAYALMLCERGDARRRGSGHEDADPLALQVAAEGDLLVLDPGYAGWTQVERTHAPEHHALVLVDGRGPATPRWSLFALGWAARDVDCQLDLGSPRTFDGPRVASAVASAAYEGVDVRRTTSLVLGRFLVVEDDVRGRKAHDLTVNLPLGGGAKKAGPAAPTPVGATFASHRRAVPAEVAVATTQGPPRLDLGQGFDALGAYSGGGADAHAVLKATVRAARAKLLTVLVWGPPGAAPARPARLLDVPGATALGAAWGTTTLVALSQEGAGVVVVPATATTPRLETDGALVLVALEGGVVKAVVAHDAQRARVGDGAGVLELTRPTRGTIRHAP